VTLTYSFMTRLPSDASNDDANGFAPMTEAQKAGVRTALATWAAVANIKFTEVSANGDFQMATNNQGKSEQRLCLSAERRGSDLSVHEQPGRVQRRLHAGRLSACRC
jgi:hypothetical protein